MLNPSETKDSIIEAINGLDIAVKLLYGNPHTTNLINDALQIRKKLALLLDKVSEVV